MTPYTVIPLKMISVAKSTGTSPFGMPSSCTRPPMRTAANAWCRAEGMPDISHTTSAPSPPVSSTTVRTTSSCAADPHREAADRPAPDDEHGAARNIGGQHRVERVAHRIHDGPDGGRDAVEGQDVRGGHRDVFGERPVQVHADDARVAADVAVSGAALHAVPAHDVTLGGDELPALELGDAVAHRDDLARELVTDHQRRLKAALRPRIPIGDVQVSAAHTGVADRDEHFARSGGRLGDGRDFQTGGALLLDDRLHVSSGRGPRATGPGSAERTRLGAADPGAMPRGPRERAAGWVRIWIA